MPLLLKRASRLKLPAVLGILESLATSENTSGRTIPVFRGNDGRPRTTPPGPWPLLPPGIHNLLSSMSSSGLT